MRHEQWGRQDVVVLCGRGMTRVRMDFSQEGGVKVALMIIICLGVFARMKGVSGRLREKKAFSLHSKYFS